MFYNIIVCQSFSLKYANQEFLIKTEEDFYPLYCAFSEACVINATATPFNSLPLEQAPSEIMHEFILSATNINCSVVVNQFDLLNKRLEEFGLIQRHDSYLPAGIKILSNTKAIDQEQLLFLSVPTMVRAVKTDLTLLLDKLTSFGYRIGFNWHTDNENEELDLLTTPYHREVKFLLVKNGLLKKRYLSIFKRPDFGHLRWIFPYYKVGAETLNNLKLFIYQAIENIHKALKRQNRLFLGRAQKILLGQIKEDLKYLKSSIIVATLQRSELSLAELEEEQLNLKNYRSHQQKQKIHFFRHSTNVLNIINDIQRKQLLKSSMIFVYSGFIDPLPITNYKKIINDPNYYQEKLKSLEDLLPMIDFV